MGFNPTQADSELERELSSSGKFDPALAEADMDSNSDSAKLMLGPNFDPETFAGPGLRWSLARGDNLEEKKLRLKKKYPGGDIRVLPESIVMGFSDDTLVWRETEQSQWKMIEPQGFEWDDLGMDVAEAIAPSAESIVGETLLAIGTGGGSVPVTVGRQVLGALIGETIEQATQYVTGVQDQSIGEVAMEVGVEGAWSGGGGFAMSPLAGLYNGLRGAGALRVGDDGLEVIRAANELDRKGIGEKLTPGLTTDNPAMILQEAQGSALLPSFRRRYREMLKALDVAVLSSAPGNAAEAMRGVVTSLRDFSNFFLGKIKRAGVPLGEAGKALQAGVEVYGKQSKVVVDDLYTAAGRIQDPIFDMEPFHVVAGDLRAGAKGKFNKQLNDPLRELNSITGPKTLPSGNILSVTDQIRNVRTTLWDLKQVKPGEIPTQATGQANDLYKALTGVLENPKNADPNFLKAWGAASDASALRRKTLGQAAVMIVAKSETPFKLARSLVRPGEVDNLLALRNTVPELYWNHFVDAAYGEILKDPANAKGIFDAFDQETLDALLPRAEQKLLKRVVDELDRIGSVGVDEIAEMQIKNKNFVDVLIRETKPRDAYMMIRSMNNTNDKATRESFRAAIVEWAWDGVIEPTKSGLKANADVLKSRVKDLKKSGIWDILSTEERRIIGNAQIVSRAFQRVSDAGVSIQAAEAAKNVTRLKASAIATFVQYGIVSKLYLSNMGRKMLIGSGLPNSNAAMLRVLGGSLAQISQTEDLDALMKEQEANK